MQSSAYSDSSSIILLDRTIQFDIKNVTCA